MQEVPDNVKDAAVEHQSARSNHGMSDRLSQVTLSFRRSAAMANPTTSGKFSLPLTSITVCHTFEQFGLRNSRLQASLTSLLRDAIASFVNLPQLAGMHVEGRQPSAQTAAGVDALEMLNIQNVSVHLWSVTNNRHLA